ncbi:MAG: hypothetical protein ACK5O2_07445 [Microthrixaceae bacterium]
MATSPPTRPDRAPRIVLVHGAFNELWGPHEIASRWVPALRDGLWHHGVEIDDSCVDVCFYGDLFRPDADTIDSEAWKSNRAGAAEVLTKLSGDGDSGDLAKVLGQAASAAAWERTIDMITMMTTDPKILGTTLGRLRDLLTDGADVLVAHSLGTIFTYSLLQREPELEVDTLVTIGCPLGNRAIEAFLVPRGDDGFLPWPGSVKRWVNVAAVGDHATGDGRLAESFGDRVEDRRVDNGHRAHDPEPYLNSAATGDAVAEAIRSL